MTLADRIKPHVSEIERRSREGCKKSKAVINLYQMHVASPSDPGAPALCDAAFGEWCEEYVQ